MKMKTKKEIKVKINEILEKCKEEEAPTIRFMCAAEMNMLEWVLGED